MSEYVFKTSLYMKEYNCNKYFIMVDYVRNITIKAQNVNEALNEYYNKLENDYSITISKNARNHKEPIYNINDEQIGYSFTGKTGFEDRHYNMLYTEQYIEVRAFISKQLNAFI